MASTPCSKKTYVIERLFNERWDAESQTLSRSLVTLSDLLNAIQAHNRAHPGLSLSERNPANFFKDFIRKSKSANENWPGTVLANGFTGRQVTGESNCFEFLPLPSGQLVPFPDDVLKPSDQAHHHQIESISLPLASRRLGRADEAWLTQVLVRLRVLETHFSIYSTCRVMQFDHLQMGVKLHKTEIDALFLALVENPAATFSGGAAEESGTGGLEEVIVTCEAKGRRDDILVDQIVRQVQSVFTKLKVTQERAIPVAVKAINNNVVWVVEFDAVTRSEAPSLRTLKVASEALYKFKPSIPGIGH
jgi:hypothetical protein